MSTQPIAEVMLRVRLADALTPVELETVSRIAEEEESVDAAVIKILRAGMAAIRPSSTPEGGLASGPGTEKDTLAVGKEEA